MVSTQPENIPPATRPAPRSGGLVLQVAERLRDQIFAGEPDARLGSLAELAAHHGVGVVTIQQAARVLEHEGLLEVRRGPGGGYYGRRPGDAALERALAAFMRAHPYSFAEALDITSLLFIELCGASSRCGDAALRRELTDLAEVFGRCDDEAAMGVLEAQLQDLLFRMVDRPIFALLTRVTLRFAASNPHPPLYAGTGAIAGWTAGRRRIIAAIAGGDEALARFEADRSNRQPILATLRQVGHDAGEDTGA